MPQVSDRPDRRESLGLRAGDWVEVRNEDEILSTLDAEGCLDALPFMPEMLRYCGKRFQVFKSAHKACDTIRSWSRIRLMKDAVHLQGLRCDGEAHGGCQAGCLLYWKEAWLKRAPGPASKLDQRSASSTSIDPPGRAAPRCDVNALHRATRAATPAEAGAEERFRCQATDLPRATVRARRWDLRHYVRDLLSGNVRRRDFIRYGLYAAFNNLRPFPHIRGLAGEKTPLGEVLDLRPGEWVQVRSQEEILRTLNPKLRHRGLFFDVEMLPFCGRTYRIHRRVERLIDDKTGLMRLPRSACFILENVACSGCLSRGRMFCPRSIYPFWHEIWLQRVDVAQAGSGIQLPKTSETHAITAHD